MNRSLITTGKVNITISFIISSSQKLSDDISVLSRINEVGLTELY